MTQKNTPRGMLLNVEVLNLSVRMIKDLLGLDSAPNVDYGDEMVVYHLLNACASQTSVSQVSDVCVDGPSEGTIRYRLRKLDLEKVQEALNDKLKVNAVETVSRNLQTFAIDFVNIPYYGEEENKGDTIKTKPKQGTSRFYAYASIYLILKNKRYTLAVKYIRKGETLKDTINFLIKEIESIGFKIKGLYLDREFFTVNVLDYLQKRKTSLHHPLCDERTQWGNTKAVHWSKKLLHTIHHAF